MSSATQLMPMPTLSICKPGTAFMPYLRPYTVPTPAYKPPTPHQLSDKYNFYKPLFDSRSIPIPSPPTMMLVFCVLQYHVDLWIETVITIQQNQSLPLSYLQN
jgi:hypothetical protein